MTGGYMAYVSDIDEWAEKCVADPKWLAESMQRIGRFGGQHPTSNVLIHSLEVAWMLRGSSPEVQLWALYHDAHETLTNDTPRPFKCKCMTSTQMVLDALLKVQFGIQIVCDTVEMMDKVCGDAEHDHWGDVIFHFSPSECVHAFVTKSAALLAVIKSRKENP